jgi:hypothetical protein
VFGEREKGVDIGTYRARNGIFAVKSTVKKTTATQEVTEGKHGRFVGLVMMVLLAAGGVELNPGPTVEQEKIDQILTHMRNQERESKVIKSFWRLNHVIG